MLTSALALWWACIFLEFLILFRAAKTSLFRTYPFFWAYLVCVFLSDLTAFFLYEASTSHAYRYFYWTKEFVCVIAGYCVVLEIIQVGFASYNGAKKLATNIGLTLFACIVALTAWQSVARRRSALVVTSLEVERDLRAAELVILGLVIVLLAYYRVGIGRNLKGILLGYGFSIAAITMANAFGSYAGPTFSTALSFIRSYSYSAALLIWVFTLWSHQPNPVPRFPKEPPQDYSGLVDWAKDAIHSVRGQLGKARA